ncbi:MAG: tRNA 5-methylaminomethyl-2-thiouridine biosynthesis bifunctional protein [Verrucomicrobia bacterium]|nr:MAG: tRNA 5-methylaminomethyl-2-thiouridine biosynthesis bifunctional protein [Verrucomicrobiota bacterium]
MDGASSETGRGAVPPSAPWLSAEHFCILDTDFNDGADFVRLRRLWEASPGTCISLHYIALCAAPKSSPPPELQALWPLPLPGHHELELNAGALRLTVIFRESPAALRRLKAVCDLILLKEPTLQTAALARLSRFGTAVQSTFQDTETNRALEASGFRLEPAATHIEGTYRVRSKRAKGWVPFSGERHAIVLGAGLAGSAAAASLSRRGWRVSVIEKRAAPALAASGNLTSVISPMLSKDDGVAARLSRASFLTLLQELHRISAGPSSLKWAPCGVLQMARSPKEELLLAETILSLAYPAAFARFLTREEACRHVEQEVPAGGVLFPQGGWVNPPSLCLARMQSAPILLQTGVSVSKLERKDGSWRVFDDSGRPLAEAPVLVLANAFESTRFAQAEHLHFKKVRGQVTHVPASHLPPLGCVLSRDGYLTPPLEGHYSLGATYDFGSEEESLTVECQNVNLARMPLLLEGTSVALDSLLGRVGFRTLTPDRLPVVGAMPDFEAQPAPPGALGTLPRQAGLFTLLGLGSRGVVWSALAGETLAALIEGEAPPLPSDLLEAMDPARFLARKRGLEAPRIPL